MNNLDLLRPSAVFHTVVEQGSFRAAADSLGLSPPYISQMVSDLEARLGRQLLYRSTRKIALTEAGEAYLPHAAAMAAAFQDGLDSLQGKGHQLRGRLRVTAPTVAAGPRFARIVAQFARAHPDVGLEIILDDTVIDPVAARVDLAIRIGDPGEDPRLARKLFETRGLVCCAPAQAGAIQNVQDLHHLLWLRTPTMLRTMLLYHGDGTEAVCASEHQLVLNSAAMIRAVLAEGSGFAIFPDFAVRDALSDGVLCNPLPDFATHPVPAYALFTERRTELTNARAFVDVLVNALVTQNA